MCTELESRSHLFKIKLREKTINGCKDFSVFFGNPFRLGVKPIKNYMAVNVIIIFIYSFGHFGNIDDL